jgi:mannose/fructose/N-acetylgalactosamine-specific phosphotransferase system component IID
MEKVIKRLKDLYKGRETSEKALISALRYYNSTEKVNEIIKDLSDYAVRISELEILLDFETIKSIKTELGIV